jgi:CelD/BcsL family acetyltransferase involved in cellulose biosynthesis
MPPTFRVSEVRGLAGLEELHAPWEALLARARIRPHFLEHAWCLASLRHASVDPETLRFLIVEDGAGVVQAIIPLEPRIERIRRKRVPVLALLGANSDRILRHSYAADFPCASGREEEVLRSVIRYLGSRPESPCLLLLARVGPGSSALGALPTALRVVQRVGGFNVIGTDRPYPDLLASLGKNFRGNLRKARNKLQAEVAPTFHLTTGGVAHEDAFESFLRVEASGWKGAAGTASAAQLSPELGRFLREVILGPMADGRAQVHALEADGQCIAAQLCLAGGGELTILKTAYDERFSRYSPGQLLLEKVLQQACDDPDTARVNLVTDMAWHRDWRPELIPTFDVYLPLRLPWALGPLLLLRTPTFRDLKRMARWRKPAAGAGPREELPGSGP